jgi:hypothetical protein
VLQHIFSRRSHANTSSQTEASQNTLQDWHNWPIQNEHHGSLPLPNPDALYPIPVEEHSSQPSRYEYVLEDPPDFSRLVESRESADKLCLSCKQGLPIQFDAHRGRALKDVLLQSSKCSLCLLIVQVISRHWSIAGFPDLSQVDQGCVIFF